MESFKRKKEDTLMVLNPSRRSFLLEYCCGIFLVGLLSFFIYKKIDLNTKLTYFVFGLALFSIGSAEISRLLHRCRVTHSKLVIIDGMIKLSKKHIYIKAISDINIKQKVIQRLLNYGVIHIKTMSGESSLEIKNVANPGKRMEEIEEIIEKYKNRKTTL
jgi:uncharacterized membrane protein YdbT with pleckstrin-like domain